MAGLEKKKYIAKVGINFDGLKPPVRVESGQPIPARVAQSDIDDLLKIDAIEEVKDTKQEAK